MSQELSLVLATPVEQLVPLLIKWNNTELMEAVESTLAAYEGVTYTDEQVGIAKKDKATLNAFIKALNDERIRISKVYAAPYEKFKGEVDEVITKVKSAVEGIDTQLKAYEQARVDKRQAEVIEYYNSVIGDLAECIPYAKIHDPKWLNASTRPSAYEAAIDKIIESAQDAIGAIEALHSDDEATIKAYYFRTLNLGAALMENERLKSERARVAEFNARREAEAKARAEAEAAAKVEVRTPSPAIEKNVSIEAPKPELSTLDFRVVATVEQLKALRTFLVSNNIKFYKI